ncbi:alpha/beta hydrolase [Akkermansiaceae bacterium]|nr:alpha/beta hydrolase [Akkermansiaceae bacterium]
MTYKRGEDFKLKLHGFKPDGHKSSDKRAAIVFFFGGGWIGGTPKQFYQQADFFADQGVVAFSADYRVKGRDKTTPFDAVEDAKSAIRWVRKHASELGVDPDRIIASGVSAGGHIAGCTGIIKGLEAKGEDHSISSVPNAMILFNPVLDTTENGYGLEKVGEDRKTEVSLTHQVHSGIVPTLVFHGTADKTVPFENAERFQSLMAEAGNKSQLVAVEGKGHGCFNSPFFRPQIKNTKYYDDSLNDSLNFLEKYELIDLEVSE